MKTSTFVFAIAAASPAFFITDAQTYKLSYSALIYPEVSKLLDGCENVEATQDTNEAELTGEPPIAGLMRQGFVTLDFITKTLGEIIITGWNRLPSNQNKSGGTEDLIFNCFTVISGKKRRCFADYDMEINFSIDSKVHTLSKHHGKKAADVFSNKEKKSNDRDTAWRLSVDIVVDVHKNDVPGFFPRDALIHAYLRLESMVTVDNPVWTIDEHLSPLDKAVNEESSRQAEEIAPARAASLETLILSNVNAISRVPHKTFSLSWGGDEMYDLSASTIDVWTVQEVGKSPITSLFIDGKLRATTGDAGRAHAEAFVHPALVAHPFPRYVAVISDMPSAVLVEILKHKSVEEVTVLGFNNHSIDLSMQYFANSTSCFSEGKFNSCNEDERVRFVKDSVDTWLDAEIEYFGESDDDYFDAVFIDASVSPQYLSRDFSKKLKDIISDDSMVIFNTGSTPSLDLYSSTTDSIVRDDFLQRLMLQKDSEYGHAMVYDEPSAAPFDTTFIAIFPVFYDNRSETYFRFVRPTPYSIDLDIVDRLKKQPSLPTYFYDGATHEKYLIPSRVWEKWYCRSEKGQNHVACKTFLEKMYDPEQYKGVTEVKRDPVKGRGVYAVNDIPKGSFINADDAHMNLHIHRYQWEALNKFVDDYPDAQMYRQLRDFYIAYGFENEPNGLSGWTVSVAVMNTFVNHACSKEDENASGYAGLDADDYGSEIMFSPLGYRRKFTYMTTVATRDITAGEEIQMNYAPFRTFMTEEYSNLLQNFCTNGEGLVPVAAENATTLRH